MDDSEDFDCVDARVFHSNVIKHRINKEQWKIQQTSDEDVYDFNHIRRGIAVIILNDEVTGAEKRQGCDKDQENLQMMFTHLGFELRTFFGKSKEELMQALGQIAKEDHTQSDCIAVAISTHGKEETTASGERKDFISATDQHFEVSDILDKFSDKNCPTLLGKPRFFFVQACRGVKLDSGVDLALNIKGPTSPPGIDVPDTEARFGSKHLQAASPVCQPQDTTDAVPFKVKQGLKQTQTTQTPAASFTSSSGVYVKAVTVRGNVITQEKTASEFIPLSTLKTSPAPCSKDYLVIYAAPPGHFAFRNQVSGSWFITCLHDVLGKTEGNRTLIHDLTRVTRKMALDKQSCSKDIDYSGKKQIPVIYSMLTKDVYLKPKKDA